MKVEQLTFTRFVAAMLVVLFHIGGSRLASTSLVGSLLEISNSAVSYFFALSGFILIISTVRDGRLPGQLPKIAFWRNRFARIYPLYVFALILTILLGVVTASTVTGIGSVGSVVASALLMQAWWPRVVMELNYPGWSLSVETLFYLLFPFLYVAAIRLPIRWLLLITGLFWALSLAIYVRLTDGDASHNLALYFPPLHLNTFLVGMATGVTFVRHRSWLMHHHRWVTVLFLLLMGGSCWIVLAHSPLLRYYHNGLFAPVFAVFMVWLSTQANGVTRWLSRPLPVWLGEISYGIYLLQVPVGMAAFYLNRYWLHWPTWVYIPVYLGLLIAVSAVCYRRIEQPARRLIRQFSQPVLATAPADEPVSRPV